MVLVDTKDLASYKDLTKNHTDRHRYAKIDIFMVPFHIHDGIVHLCILGFTKKVSKERHSHLLNFLKNKSLGRVKRH